MPVTARLSKRFYEQFGDDVTNELVEWFNAVDAAYRADLRDLNEFNFARFDAKVDQRFAESDARLEKRFAEFEVKIERRFAGMEITIATTAAQTRSQILTWMFGLWITSALALAALILTKTI